MQFSIYRSERCREEADNWSARAKLPLSLREDVGVREDATRTKGPRVGFAKLLCDLGDGVVDDGIGTCVKFPEDQGIREGVGDAHGGK